MIECFYSVNKKKTIQIIKDYRTRRDETSHIWDHHYFIISFNYQNRSLWSWYDERKCNVILFYKIWYIWLFLFKLHNYHTNYKNVMIYFNNIQNIYWLKNQTVFQEIRFKSQQCNQNLKRLFTFMMIFFSFNKNFQQPFFLN